MREHRAQRHQLAIDLRVGADGERAAGTEFGEHAALGLDGGAGLGVVDGGEQRERLFVVLAALQRHGALPRRGEKLHRPEDLRGRGGAPEALEARQRENRAVVFARGDLLQPRLDVVLAVMTSISDVDPTAAIIAWSIATLAAVLLALLLLRDDVQMAELVKVDVVSLRRQIKFGLQGQIGNLIQLLNYRLDQYIVLLFVNTAAVGIYAVSVTVSQSVWFVANAVATVLLPRLTSAGDAEAARTTPLVCRNTLFMSALGALALAAVSPWLVGGLFGAAFEDALEPLLWLLPGTVALAGSKVLSSYILSRGQPLTNSAITAVVLAVTLGAGFALIPPFDLTGAAIASSLAYAVHFVLSLAAYQRLSGGSIVEALFVRPEDVRYLIRTAREQLAAARR